MPNDSSNHFQRNSNLFTALGVFGAISVYFTQLQLNTRWRRLGIVSSLTIFLLVAVSIQRNLPPESSDKEPFDYVVDVLLQKPGQTLFYVSFWSLVISVVAIIVSYSDTFLFLTQFFVFLVGFAGARRLVIEIERSLDDNLADDVKIELGKGQLPVIYSLFIIRNALYTVIIGSGGLVLSWHWGLLVWQQLVTLRSPSLLSSILVGVLTGLVGGGIVFTGIGLGMLAIHFMVISIQERGIEDEMSRYMGKFGYQTPEGEE